MKTTKNAGGESLEETLQQFTSNLGSMQAFDKEAKTLSEGLLESGYLGFITSMPMSATQSIMETSPQKPETPTTQAEPTPTQPETQPLKVEQPKTEIQPPVKVAREIPEGGQIFTKDFVNQIIELDNEIKFKTDQAMQIEDIGERMVALSDVEALTKDRNDKIESAKLLVNLHPIS